jgi:hypothetical protein
MNVDHYQQQELSHIERMIAELERLVQRDRLIGEQNPVIRPEYWRNRIHASVNASEATVSATKHAAVLLGRLASLTEMLDRRTLPDQIK